MCWTLCLLLITQLWFRCWSSRFKILYTIRIQMHLHTWRCSSRWIETDLRAFFPSPHTTSSYIFQTWLYWGKNMMFEIGIAAPHRTLWDSVLVCAFFCYLFNGVSHITHLTGMFLSPNFLWGITFKLIEELCTSISLTFSNCQRNLHPLFDSIKGIILKPVLIWMVNLINPSLLRMPNDIIVGICIYLVCTSLPLLSC